MSSSKRHAALQNDPFLNSLEARTRAMAEEVVEAAQDSAAAQAEASLALAAHAEPSHVAAGDAATKRATQAAPSMSGNVRFCPLSRSKQLPKPPQPPEDPTEADLIVAADDEQLSPAQRIAVAALVCGQTAIVAAQRAGVTARTIRRWRQEAAFNDAIDRLSDETMEAAGRRVRNLLLRGTHVIADALQGSDQYRWAMRVVGSSQVWKMGQRSTPAASSAEK